jgi:hypothetical protein
VVGRSALVHNLVWRNGAELEGCRVEDGSVIEADPQLDAAFRPARGGACIDAGALRLDLKLADRTVTPAAFRGAAPDLGAVEVE